MAAQTRFSLRAFALRTLHRILGGGDVRGYDAASWTRFAPEARSGRVAQDTIRAAPQVRARARYFVANEAFAAAAVNAIETYAVGAGPIPAHDDADLTAKFLEWWDVADAEQRADFGAIIAAAVRAMIVDGEVFLLFVQTADGLRLRLLPAEQIAEDETRELGGGAFIAAGVEFDSQGRRVAYWIRPFVPTQQFETYARPVRVDAADVLHLMRPVGVGQVRGVSALAPVLLKLADLGLLSDALLKGFQVAAMHAGFLEDQNGISQLPFDGKQTDDALTVSLEPGTIRKLPAGYKISFNNPQAANQSIEFRTSIIEEIAAGLGVPAFMVSGNVNRANYSSLRAALITFKASLESLQYNIIVPQLLNPIWKRWALTEALRNGGDADSAAPEWRFPAMPEADPLKQVQATVALLNAKLASRKEAIAQRGEDITRVDADIAADPFANQAEDEKESDDETA